MIRFLNKIGDFKKNITIRLIVVLTIAVISIIPLWRTYGTLKIGGDTIIPLIPEFSYRNSYEWIEIGNGFYATTDFLSWVFLFDLLKKIGFSLYQIGFVFQFLIFFISGLCIYKIFNLFNSKSKFFGLLPAIAFIYSPYLYDHMVYFYTTATSVWLIYFLMKFIKLKKFTIFDIICLAILTAFLGNLPNPKYHFSLFLIYLATFGIALFIRQISLKNLKENLSAFILLVLMTSHLSLRLLYYGISFAKSELMVKTTREIYGKNQAIDYGLAIISQMIRLWHSPSMNPPELAIMQEPFFTFSYYIIPILVLGVFPFLFSLFDKTTRRIYFIFYFLTLLFLFLAKSSNPPFGQIYDWMVKSAKVFSFMRTSAGMVIYAGIFYSLLFGLIVQHFFFKLKISKIIIIALSIIVILIPGYHIWSGKYFLNYSPVNKHIDRNAYGLIIPKDYFESAYFLHNLKLDTKIDIIPGAEGYQNNNWGYFGFLIYPWLLDKPIINLDKSKEENWGKSYFNNTRYVYYDKTLLTDKEIMNLILQKYRFEDIVFSAKNIDIFRKPDNLFIPHFYLPKRYSQSPVIEYKKINPTKYRVKIHKADKLFSLLFTENYHKDWKVYQKKYLDEKPFNSESKIRSVDKAYKGFPLNEEDQATRDEVKSFIQNGFISTWGNQTIDFISKDFKGTIQNDNLSDGGIFETLWMQPLDFKFTQLKADESFNTWVINPKKICSDQDKLCKKNFDGTYDMELVIEFWPQKLANVAYFISASSLLVVSILFLSRKTISSIRRA